MNVKILNEDGSQGSDFELADEIFGAKVNVALMHQVVTAQLAAARSGTHSTKTRGEVRGGGAKPWRQKGTGRARHGSNREPQWPGGGITFGPKPRNYEMATPKKMKALALRSALSARAAEGKVLVAADLEMESPKTSRALHSLKAWKTEGGVLAVISADQLAIRNSFRNLSNAHVLSEAQLNTYDVLRCDTVVFFKSAIDAFQTRTRSKKVTA